MYAPPEWIVTFANAVSSCYESFEPLPPIGCHYFFAEAGWEITVFPSLTEIVGGPEDGRKTAARVCVQVARAVSLFSEVREISWQCRPVNDDDELGAHLYIDGTHDNQAVSVQMLATAPPSFEPGRRAHFHQGRMSDAW